MMRVRRKGEISVVLTRNALLQGKCTDSSFFGIALDSNFGANQNDSSLFGIPVKFCMFPQLCQL